ncbi:PspA/IM30 family protein [Oricola sp.]|uniref:PspA/IM30 family protein n=1 Tax=Oricola sp. TaxID=1979950 RepID=UPI0025DBD0FF|nr:PspA/IM30 family protein [Oricola sp.]MCI5078424.1 PspA/IM30 family protein [Oricola sp.]
MFAVLRTLIEGAGARTEETIRDRYAVDLLEQKIRESEAALAAAKETLAALILRERNERSGLEKVRASIADLETRTRSALAAGDENLAGEAARALAELENERETREKTVERLSQKAARMRLSVERTHRRVTDLRQGMIQARAIDAEQRAQKKLNRSLGDSSSIREAQALLDRILDRDDPFEEGRVLDEIDDDLAHRTVRDRLAEAGHGARTRHNAEDILQRLRAGS